MKTIGPHNSQTPGAIVAAILGRRPGTKITPRVVMADGTLLVGGETYLIKAEPVRHPPFKSRGFQPRVWPKLITCPICGAKLLKNRLQRHLRMVHAGQLP